jgi:hypothetical protein
MSRYFPDRKDSTGWKRGQGPYSRSHPKTTDKAPPGMSKRYPEPEGPWAEFYKTPGAAPRVQDLIAGKDISARVFGTGNRNYGLSAPVSSNRRPAHRAESSARGSGIDPSTPQFKKHRDYR